MKLQFKHQAFQREAARAVIEVFRGQPLQDAFAYSTDLAKDKLQLQLHGFRNHEIELSDEELTRNIREVQHGQDLKPIERVLRDDNGTLALSIEMETGTGIKQKAKWLISNHLAFFYKCSQIVPNNPLLKGNY